MCPPGSTASSWCRIVLAGAGPIVWSMSTNVTDRVRLLLAARWLAARRAARLPASPIGLAQRLIPGYRVTPALALLSDELERAVTEPEVRLLITTPPRTGKSKLTSQVLPVWALARNPDLEVMGVSHGDDLALEHSREARRLVRDNGSVLGFKLAQDKSSAGRWRVDGQAGGMWAGGIMSGNVGFGSDLLLLDDVVKSAQEADSPAHRRRVSAEFHSSLMSRLHPGGSVVLVMTRWHPEDLAGELLAEGGWRHVNIPAVAEVGVADVLGRRPGVAMISALGRTAAGFAELRRAVGERVWFALYEGVPSPVEGGLVQRSWFEEWRLESVPGLPVRTVVGVDPSDSGRGDACGIVAASLMGDGSVVVTHDVSAPLTSDAWSRRAVELAFEVGASEVVVEGFTTAATYERVVGDAVARFCADHPELARRVGVRVWRARGDAFARSEGLLQALETGRCRVVGCLALEGEAVLWQSGQHQPDGLAALVIAFDVLSSVGGVVVAAPGGRLGGGRLGVVGGSGEVWWRRSVGGRRVG